MAYQNFFATSNNGRRATPAQCSGKEVTSEFRMRNEGSSELVCSCEGIINPDNTITTIVTVHLDNGETVTHEVTYKK